MGICSIYRLNIAVKGKEVPQCLTEMEQVLWAKGPGQAGIEETVAEAAVLTTVYLAEDKETEVFLAIAKVVPEMAADGEQVTLLESKVIN